MCGDVMTGRGIDQVLPYPSKRFIPESYVKDAAVYVQIAENANGKIEKPVPFSYIWGDALAELDERAPDVRIINLETAVTGSDDWWKGKGINYRMNPGNMPALAAAKIDIAALANNHVLDWGYKGLSDTLLALKGAGIKYAGAGANSTEAEAPAVAEVRGKGRVLLFSFGEDTAGILREWTAGPEKAGVNFLKDLSHETATRIAKMVRARKRKNDIAIVSIHWGSNWGYDITDEQRAFAHALVKDGVDIIHGHSSHHVKGLEIFRDKLILYGCGDFINDYEGIAGHETFRADLGLMYFVNMDPSTGGLSGLELVPTRIKNLRVNRASRRDALWLMKVLEREHGEPETLPKLNKDNSISLKCV